MKTPERVKVRTDRLAASWAALPTWKFVTYLVGIMQLIASLAIMQSPASGTLNLVRHIIPGQSLDPQSFSRVLEICGLILIFKPGIANAIFLTFPIAVWIASLTDFVYRLSPDDPAKNYVGVVLFVVMYAAVVVAMSKDRHNAG